MEQIVSALIPGLLGISGQPDYFVVIYIYIENSSSQVSKDEMIIKTMKRMFFCVFKKQPARSGSGGVVTGMGCEWRSRVTEVE